MLPSSMRRDLVDPSAQQVSIRRQCTLLAVPRSTFYAPAIGESPENERLMKKIDRVYTRYPFYGVRRITDALNTRGLGLNHKRIARLMQLMGLAALMPASNRSAPGEGHHIYPYLLRNMRLSGPNQVWCSDITYLPMHHGWVYLVAIMDWWARYILAWRLSRTLEADFCCQCLTAALQKGQPRIFNTDQGRQFTSLPFTSLLHEKDILISMDGRGRYHDNIFIERFWRSLKYEDVYLQDYATFEELEEGVRRYIRFYNDKRGHQSLGRRTPADTYFERAA